MPDVVTENHFLGSVYHLIYYGNTIKKLYQTMLSVGLKLNQDEKNVIRFLIQSKTMLDTISLIDELNNYLFRYKTNDSELSKRIASYENIINPLLDQISLWDGLRKFRNNVLAHNFRIDSENFESVHLANKLHIYEIPNSSIDLEVLFKIIEVATNVAEEIFANEYEIAKKIISSQKTEKTVLKQSIDIELLSINNVLKKVNQRIADYNKGLLKVD